MSPNACIIRCKDVIVGCVNAYNRFMGDTYQCHPIFIPHREFNSPMGIIKEI
jgi:hypothetical protein